MCEFRCLSARRLKVILFPAQVLRLSIHAYFAGQNAAYSSKCRAKVAWLALWLGPELVDWIPDGRPNKTWATNTQWQICLLLTIFSRGRTLPFGEDCAVRLLIILTVGMPLNSSRPKHMAFSALAHPPLPAKNYDDETQPCSTTECKFRPIKTAITCKSPGSLFWGETSLVFSLEDFGSTSRPSKKWRFVWFVLEIWYHWS